MLLAALSELVLLAAIAYGWHVGRQTDAVTRVWLALALLTLAGAALMGFLRYLNWEELREWHSQASLLSRHIGLPVVVLVIARHCRLNRYTHRVWRGLVGLVVANALISLLWQPLPFSAEALVILTLCLTLWAKANNGQAIGGGMLVAMILLSTPLLNLFMDNANLRIGIFHLCLSVFLVGWFQQLPPRNRNIVGAYQG